MFTKATCLLRARKPLWIALLLIIAFNAYPLDCEQDYLAYQSEVLALVTSLDESDKAKGTAQRDCLALMLQGSSGPCDTFEEFKRTFLSLSTADQTTRGPVCFQGLTDKLDTDLHLIELK